MTCTCTGFVYYIAEGNRNKSQRLQVRGKGNPNVVMLEKKKPGASTLQHQLASCCIPQQANSLLLVCCTDLLNHAGQLPNAVPTTTFICSVLRHNQSGKARTAATGSRLSAALSSAAAAKSGKQIKQFEITCFLDR